MRKINSKFEYIKEYFKIDVVYGNRREKIYGKLTCPSRQRLIEKGFKPSKKGVPFINRSIAELFGYRPCRLCIKTEDK